MDDKLRSKITESLNAVRGTAHTATIKEVVEEVAEFEGYRLSNLLKDRGFDHLSDRVATETYDPAAPACFSPSVWGELKVGAYIPDLAKFSNYMPDPKHLARLFLFLNKKWSMLFSGPPGTGKTTLAEFAAALLGQPFFRLNMNGFLESADVVGHQSVEAGSLRWVDGVLTVALREGYFVCIDEVWRAPPFFPLTMQSMLDNGRVFRLLGKHEDDTLYPDERLQLVFTDNTKGTGDQVDRFSTAQVQDTSFINRVRGTLNIGYMPKDTECVSLVSEFDVDGEAVEKLVELAGLARVAYLKGELSLVMSKRQLETICGILPHVGKREAIDVAFYSALPEDEVGVFEELYRTVYAEVW